MFLRRSVVSAAGAACLLGWVAQSGCSGSQRDSTTGSNNPSTGAGADAGGNTGSGGNPSGAGSGSGSPGGGGNTPPPTEIDGSFIWIANTTQGTVSKIDTRTLTELGRYTTSPLGQGKPSRTSVALDGSVAVANRGGEGTLPSVETGVTKIYASLEQCEDRNGNGTIDSSSGKDDVRPWLEDECIAWHRPLNYWSNRPVAWAPQTDPDSLAPASVWTAGASTCDSSVCNFDVLRLDGATGQIEDTIKVGPLMGPDFLSGGGLGGGGGFPGGILGGGGFPGGGIPGGSGVLVNYGPYGGASDAGGNFWIFTGTTTHLVRVDAITLKWKSWPVPGANGYGITIDPKGRVFVCGAQGVSRFDPSNETWAQSSASNLTLGYNGCMVDGKTTIWVGGGVDLGDPGLHSFDIDTLAFIQSFAVGPVKGVSIDIDGFIWGVSAAGGSGFGGGRADTAYRLDPKTGDVKSYTGLTGAYSYSDMTGFGLKQAGVVPVI